VGALWPLADHVDVRSALHAFASEGCLIRLSSKTYASQ